MNTIPKYLREAQMRLLDGQISQQQYLMILKHALNEAKELSKFKYDLKHLSIDELLEKLTHVLLDGLTESITACKVKKD